MDASLFNEYLEKRYYDQIKYYSSASAKNQKKYKNFQWILIIFSTLTTILAALPRSEKFDVQYLIVLSSALVTILTAALKTFQYQELWVSYRNTIEQLKPELFYYQFNVGDYAQEGVDKETIFVARIEQILNKEREVWPVAKKVKDQSNQGQDIDELQTRLNQQLRDSFNKQKQTTQASDAQQEQKPAEETVTTDQTSTTSETGGVQPTEEGGNTEGDVPSEETKQ